MPSSSTSTSRSPARDKAIESAFGQDHLLALGARLKEARESRRWSLKRLAAQSGVSVAAIQKIEQGAANAGLQTVLSLCEALGESADRLVRASRLDASHRKLVHVAIPRRPMREMELSTGLTDAHLGTRVLVVPAVSDSGKAAPSQLSGPALVYVISGRVDVGFADGVHESLGLGDCMHMSSAERATLSNSHKSEAQLLVTTDVRPTPAAPSF